LTPDGTTLFEQLSTDDKNSFLNSLVEKLAELIPVVDQARITTNRRNQPDPDAPIHQILLSVTVKSTDDKSKRTVQQIIGDLDALIRNKGYNSFSREYPTIYLDEMFGFSPAGMKLQGLTFVFTVWEML
jgi:hypothetical protein